MKIIDMSDIGKLSFPDFSVIEIKWIDESFCTISLNGAILDIGNNNVAQYNSCKIYICSWASIDIRCYDHELGQWSNNKDKEELKDICELIFDSDLIIRGFGAHSGLWIEYKFVSPKRVYSEIS